jgi:adenosylmethionine-8-amino-7-oxononanoate aminotransferase
MASKIFDEVITAFGHVGGATASGDTWRYPDIITMAKGLTKAAVPMGAVAVSRHIYPMAWSRLWPLMASSRSTATP